MNNTDPTTSRKAQVPKNGAFQLIFRIKLLLVCLFSGELSLAVSTTLLDPSFNPGEGPDGRILSVALQPDGKILIAGDFDHYRTVPRKRIARLHADGSLDTSFDHGTGTEETLKEVTVTPDGGIYVSGHFTNFAGVPIHGLVRLQSDGRVDPAFRHPLVLHPDAFVIVRTPSHSGPIPVPVKFALGADQKIYIDARPFFVEGRPLRSIIRLNHDGSLDHSFQSSFDLQEWPIHQIAPAHDGKIWLAGMLNNHDRPYGFVPLLSTGEPDPAFRLPFELAEARKLLFGTSDRIIAVGPHKVLGFLSTGAIDDTFRESNVQGQVGIYNAVLTSDNRIGLAGWFTGIDGVRRMGVARLNSNGGLDPAFDPLTGVDSVNNDPRVYDLAADLAGRFILVGDFQSFAGERRRRITRVLEENNIGEDVVYFSTSSQALPESDAGIDLKIIRAGPALTEAAVNYYAYGESAEEEVDFHSTSGTLVFLPGERQKIITLRTKEDELEEGWESLKVVLTNNSSGLRLDTAFHTIKLSIAGNDFTWRVRWLNTNAFTRETWPRTGGTQLIINSIAKFSSWNESPLPPENIFSLEVEELEAKLHRDYLPVTRPIFQNVSQPSHRISKKMVGILF